jgi:hypothetical protein
VGWNCCPTCVTEILPLISDNIESGEEILYHYVSPISTDWDAVGFGRTSA